jgi:hypothetical protein
MLQSCKDDSCFKIRQLGEILSTIFRIHEEIQVVVLIINNEAFLLDVISGGSCTNLELKFRFMSLERVKLHMNI